MATHHLAPSAGENIGWVKKFRDLGTIRCLCAV